MAAYQTKQDSPANKSGIVLLHQRTQATLAEVLTPGWYGSFGIEAEVRDGVLQQVSVQRLKKDKVSGNGEV